MAVLSRVKWSKVVDWTIIWGLPAWFHSTRKAGSLGENTIHYWSISHFISLGREKGRKRERGKNCINFQCMYVPSVSLLELTSYNFHSVLQTSSVGMRETEEGEKEEQSRVVFNRIKKTEGIEDLIRRRVQKWAKQSILSLVLLISGFAFRSLLHPQIDHNLRGQGKSVKNIGFVKTLTFFCCRNTTFV